MPRSLVRSLVVRAALAAAVLAPAAPLAAQTLHPAFQPPRVVPREFNFAIADGDGGTAFIGQWHEGMSSVSGFRFDAGLLDVDGGDVHFLFGATYQRDLNRATTDLPLDMLLTVGGQALVGDLTALEFPVGISVGRRFPLEGALAITPFIHPRVALQYCSDCDAGDSDTDIGIAFDLGADFEISRRLSLRAAFMLGSDDADAIGFGLAWRPAALGGR